MQPELANQIEMSKYWKIDFPFAKFYGEKSAADNFGEKLF